MACPNFKKGLKMAFGPLGIKVASVSLTPLCFFLYIALISLNYIILIPLWYFFDNIIQLEF
jgi:hypothetical protein